jgi:beta-lactamase regulating signal transducer with metallopeptidase domain
MKLLFLSEYLSQSIIQAICRTLLHSLWQGLLAAAIAGIIILVTKRSRAAIRYNLLSFVFISFITGAVFTFLNQPGIFRSRNTESIVHFSSLHNTFSVSIYNTDYLLPAIEKEKFYQPVIYYTDKYAGLITGLWMLFFMVHILRMLAGLHYVHRIRNYQVAEPAGEWKRKLDEMSKLLGIRKSISLMESGLVKVPVVVGLLKPLILVPVGMISNLSAEQVETILLHELAHVRRKDFAINLLQRVAEAFFFFNPFVVWISARIREEREACCDDIVMEHTADKRTYLEALVSFREAGAPAYGHAMALGRNNNLLHRVKRMITQENKKLNAMEKLTLILVLMAFGALSFMPAGKIKGNKNDDKDRQAITRPESSTQKTAPASVTKVNLPPQKQRNDTIPDQKPIEFSNISNTINDDGTTKKEEVTAKTKDGKTYNYRLVNKEIVEMTVNGQKIKKEDFHRYDGIVDQIEAAASHNENKNKALLDQKINTAGLLQKQELINNQLMDLQSKQSQMKTDELDKLIKEHKQLGKDDELALSLMQNKLQLEKQNNETLLKLQLENQMLLNQKLALEDKEMQDMRNQKNAMELLNKPQLELKNKLALIQDEKFHGSNYELSQIIAELGESGVVKDEKNFSFTLDDNELTVDGKKQSADLHDSLRKKHIKHKKDYFKYKAKDNSRSTDIYVE